LFVVVVTDYGLLDGSPKPVCRMELRLWVLGNLPCSDFVKMSLQICFRPKPLAACTTEHEILVASDGSDQSFCFLFCPGLE